MQKKRTVSYDVAGEYKGVEITMPVEGMLATALSGLPAQYRDVILLRYAYGYSVREIGNLLGCSVDAVYKRLQRAKSALKAELEVEGAVL